MGRESGNYFDYEYPTQSQPSVHISSRGGSDNQSNLVLPIGQPSTFGETKQ